MKLVLFGAGASIEAVYCSPLRSSIFFRRKLNYKPKKGEINETTKMG